jgi:hypothetical protein
VSEEAEVFMDEVEEFLTGAWRSAELDRFLTTVAFTDMLGRRRSLPGSVTDAGGICSRCMSRSLAERSRRLGDAWSS